MFIYINTAHPKQINKSTLMHEAWQRTTVWGQNCIIQYLYIFKGNQRQLCCRYLRSTPHPRVSACLNVSLSTRGLLRNTGRNLCFMVTCTTALLAQLETQRSYRPEEPRPPRRAPSRGKRGKGVMPPEAAPRSPTGARGIAHIENWNLNILSKVSQVFELCGDP